MDTKLKFEGDLATKADILEEAHHDISMLFHQQPIGAWLSIAEILRQAIDAAWDAGQESCTRPHLNRKEIEMRGRWGYGGD